MEQGPRVWVFAGDGARFAAGVFSNKETAEMVIRDRRLSGTLTAYPLDQLLFDWAIQNGVFKPKREDQEIPEFIQKFSSAYLEHLHFKEGDSSHV